MNPWARRDSCRFGLWPRLPDVAPDELDSVLALEAGADEDLRSAVLRVVRDYSETDCLPGMESPSPPVLSADTQTGE